MKPQNILRILDLAKKARDMGNDINPLFTGAAGIGKSAICQAWVKKQREIDSEFGFIDLRIAYMEAPDMRGMVEILVDEASPSGRKTVTCLPDIWPRSGKGLLLFEEPNRGTTGVMNTMMQVLTDRKVGDFELPEGWIMAGAINPDSALYDVNKMDTALKNRFVEFVVEYEHNSFVEFIENEKWSQNIIYFIKSGAWIYKDADQISSDSVYVSPRSWAKMNAAEQAGLSDDRSLHYITATSVLGKDVGADYHKFIYDEAPVTNKDLLDNKKAALKKLKEQSAPDNYKGDMIAVTVESISKNYSCKEEDDTKKQLIGEATMAEVAKIIPSDQAINLIKACILQQSKGQMTEAFKAFTTKYPELIDVLKSNIVLTRGLKK